MSFFNDVQQATNVEQVEDYVGGSFAPLTTGVYDATIKYAYATEAKSGAKGIVIGLGIGDREHSETLYITNRNKQTYYTKDGKNYPLVGYELAEALSLLGANKKLTDLTTMEKVIDVYNFEQKAKVKTAVEMFTDLVGKDVKVALQHIKEFKKTKQGNEYVDTDETREFNQLSKVFRMKDSKTVNEIRAKKDEAEFITQWADKWNGKLVDKTAGKTPKVSTNQSTQAPSIDDDLFD